jgi:hypothetical protein
MCIATVVSEIEEDEEGGARSCFMEYCKCLTERDCTTSAPTALTTHVWQSLRVRCDFSARVYRRVYAHFNVYAN